MNMPVKLRQLSLSVAILCLSVNSVFAVDQTAVEVSKQDGVITSEDLPKILESLGYDEIKPLTEGIYSFTVNINNWPCYERVSISANKKNFWVSALLNELPQPEKIPSAALLKLLVANEAIGPTYFSVLKDGETPKWLYINRSIQNQNLKPVVLREVIDGLCTSIHNSVDAWDISKWGMGAVNKSPVGIPELPTANAKKVR